MARSGMKRARRRESGKNFLDLLEEATHLLRAASAATLAAYYLGAIPFVLGFLYFWADMSRSPFAEQHLAEAALATTVLFLWMKTCQAAFAGRIRAQLAGKAMPQWSFKQGARVFFLQSVIQPTGLFALPLALVLVAPFAWVYAFYQNATVLAAGDSVETFRFVKQSWKQATLWAWQNHLGLGISFVFGCLVYLNLAVVAFSAPSLIKTLFGIESSFSRSPLAMLNTTFLASIFGLTYLSVDPILKTVYALRCFYGESLQSGEDLKAELKQFAVAPPKVAMAFVILVALWGGTATGVPRPAPQTPPEAIRPVSPPELDRRIDKVIHGQKYAWRMPRDKAAQADSEKGIITRFLERIGVLARRALRAVVDWIERLLRKLFGSDRDRGGIAGFSWMSSSLLLYALLAVVLSLLAVLLVRFRRNRRRPDLAVTAEAIQRVPDIADENVGADQLPEDGWTTLARKLLDNGEFRLAMRAFYLASLAHLATRNLIGLARFKSNRDYERELERRGHAIPSLLSVFGENVSMFERIWYGMHDVNRDLVQQFAANVERLKGGA